MKKEIYLEEFANQVKSGKSVTAKDGVLQIKYHVMNRHFLCYFNNLKTVTLPDGKRKMVIVIVVFISILSPN